MYRYWVVLPRQGVTWQLSQLNFLIKA
uniref:Uncharacterized protein n=1 Tax=Anguilla anguilla TaxID=7936 RepID=A0A0E9SE66_ANGAN